MVKFGVRARIVALAFAVLGLLVVLGGCAGVHSAKNSPQTITVWTYYNGDQLTAFNSLIEEFNSSVGAQKGIVVKGQNLGSVDDLRDAVQNSADGKVGAEDLPNIFAAYADTAYAVDKMGLLADLSPYLTPEERSQYIEGYLEEGTLGGGESIKIFPVAKSVELLLINKTDFEPFAFEAGVGYEDLQTFEGLVEVAQKYYEWTDAQTEQPNDGQAFFGIDSLANYFFIGAKQMGISIVSADDKKITLDFDQKMARRLWNHYYVPTVKGYFDATGRYRSDDVKTGNIIALIGSSSGATYFPTQVMNNEGEEHSIELHAMPCPQFEGGEHWAVQQGAGLAVVNSTDEEVAACVEFLKWFTNPAQNTKFSVSSGYLPVTKEASNIDTIRVSQGSLDKRMEEVLSCGISTVEDNQLYTPPAFKNGTEFRSILEYSLATLAASDATKVRQALENGSDLDTATASYLTDAYFEKWYNETKRQLEELVE